MSPSQLDFLKHIEHECDFVIRVCEGKSRDEVINDEILSKAIVRSLEIIGEAVKKLDDDFRMRHPDIEWKKISRTRDVIVHAYFAIDNDIIWNIIEEKLPPLQLFLLKLTIL